MVSCISPEQRIPANHPLRLIRALVLEALKDLSRSQGKFYGAMDALRSRRSSC
jgi:hypothetical protein